MFQTPERSKKYTYPKTRLSYSVYGLTFLKDTTFDKLDNVQGNVGLIRGYDFSSWLPPHLKTYPVSSLNQAIKMLKGDRISYHADDLGCYAND